MNKKGHLELCKEHPQEANCSHFDPTNCDYCKLQAAAGEKKAPARPGAQTIKAWIPGIPKGQPRARRGNVRGRLYDPGTADGWKTAVLAFLIGKLPHAPWTGPVFLSLRFHMPRPKSHYGTGKNAGRLKPSAPEYSEAKPDTDNLEKAVMDALEGRLFKNDSQVAVQPTFKPYANGPTGLELEARKL